MVKESFFCMVLSFSRMEIIKCITLVYTLSFMSLTRGSSTKVIKVKIFPFWLLLLFLWGEDLEKLFGGQIMKNTIYSWKYSWKWKSYRFSIYIPAYSENPHRLAQCQGHDFFNLWSLYSEIQKNNPCFTKYPFKSSKETVMFSLYLSP